MRFTDPMLCAERRRLRVTAANARQLRRLHPNLPMSVCLERSGYNEPTPHTTEWERTDVSLNFDQVIEEFTLEFRWDHLDR